ncbi:ubiquinol-cytochrome c reductase iron-sulfur subunit [Parafrankia irregularis]|uniref:Cytochrome bc1 complex Rieske iron-sulfur subunit n=1 Tax=Parafrankia irregularis TaxID=795642 RepID=A0A0S4R012_9ACTN|nr:MULTISPECIES: Rieske 2Fe-2S domain-containing protein [Parafrankia]MBE3206361.1 Rieske (2Fe-2S) protein [Parafrankia sp. CH37]CUU60074.1 ubiquinol-cytochrome c reductase iron-sulfur subunit [Parafrankia irregularis]
MSANQGPTGPESGADAGGELPPDSPQRRMHYAGYQGESADKSDQDSMSSVFKRTKHPVDTSGRPKDPADPRAGGPDVSSGGHDGPEVLGTPPHPTDSSSAPETSVMRPGGTATATVQGEGGGGGGGITPRAPHSAEYDRRASRRAERLIAFWFTISIVGTVGFIVTNFVGDKHEQYYTPAMGTALGLAIGGLGVGMILWAKRLMPHEHAVQERHEFTSSQEEIALTEEEVALGFADSGLAKYPLLRRSLLAAGTILGGLVVVPLLNLTNSKPGKKLDHTHWVKGARLVNLQGRYVKIGDIAIGGIETVLPAIPVKEADGSISYEPKLDVHTKADSTTILIRLEPGVNKPRPGREDWAVDGHVAYSKICTHAGCPVSLYEQQTHHLLCPCHQSVFNVPDGCRAIFGPASRSLPQLAIAVDDEGYFIARNGDYTEPVGAAFWERS